MSGEAFTMRLQLAKLGVRHGVATSSPIILPLAEPIEGPVTIEGLAATTGIDLTRQRFRSHAFDNPCLLLRGRPLPVLLWKHDPNQIAGEIESLSYDDQGNLKIRANVTHPLAKRAGAFSIGATINEYAIADADNANFHAVIRSATIDECSLTDRPANPDAIVRSRHQAAPVAAYLKALDDGTTLAIRGIEILQRMLQPIAVLASCREQKASPQPRPRLAREPHRQSDFGRLVAALEARNPCGEPS